MTFTGSRFIRPLAPLGLLMICGIACADSKPMVVDDPRPVAQAALQLESVYGVPVTYEDPPYLYEGKILDITNRVHREGQDSAVPAGRANRLLIPRGGAFSFSWDEVKPGPAQSSAQSLSALRNAISGMLGNYYSALGDADTFGVFQASRGAFHLVPNEFINADGRREKTTPIFDSPVSFTTAPGNAAAVVAEICHSVSVTTGQSIIMGTIPVSFLRRHTTTVTASGESARSVLDRLFQEFDVPLSWQLLYAPDWHVYALNIHAVTAIGSSTK